MEGFTSDSPAADWGQALIQAHGHRLPLSVLQHVETRQAAYDFGHHLASSCTWHDDDAGLPERLKPIAHSRAVPHWMFATLAQSLLESSLLLRFAALPELRFVWDTHGFVEDRVRSWVSEAKRLAWVDAYFRADAAHSVLVPQRISLNAVFLLEASEVFWHDPEQRLYLEDLLRRMVAEECYHLFEALHFPTTFIRTAQLSSNDDGLPDVRAYAHDRGERAAKLFALHYADCKAVQRVHELRRGEHV